MILHSNAEAPVAVPDGPFGIALRTPWLLTAKVTVPERAGDYFERTSPMQNLGPLTDRFITVLQATSGLGKTTLLAELSRQASQRGALSRRDLDIAEARTEGWPIALMLYRRAGAEGGRFYGREYGAELTLNFLKTRLFRNLSTTEREYLMDVAVFDWIEPELVDDVPGSPVPRLRIEALPALKGLLSPFDSAAKLTRMHPLIRQYCLDLLSDIDPDRKRVLHALIARALAKRGNFAEAWNRAAHAEDAALLNELIERVGGFSIWLKGRVAQLVSIDRPVTAGTTERYPRLALLRCAASHEGARLEDSREHGLEALARFTPKDRYGEVYVNVYLGMTATARGHVQEAVDRYARARKLTQRSFSTDACLSAVVDMLMMELDLERNRIEAVEQRTLRDLAKLRRAWTGICQAALAVSFELTAARSGPEAAVGLLEGTFERVQGLRLDADFMNFNLALWADSLVDLGRADRADRLWRERALPRGVPQILDLEAHSWRTMEALAGARVRLLEALGKFEAAAELADRLCETASARGLLRPAMRGKALGMAVKHRAGEADQAVRRLRTGRCRPTASVGCRSALRAAAGTLSTGRSDWSSCGSTAARRSPRSPTTRTPRPKTLPRSTNNAGG